MRHATSEQPWIRPGRAQGMVMCKSSDLCPRAVEKPTMRRLALCRCSRSVKRLASLVANVKAGGGCTVADGEAVGVAVGLPSQPGGA
jgi:hypothetical protein